jgi:hypothetical protein
MKAFEVLKIEEKFVLSDGRCLIMPDFPLLERLSTPVSLPAEISSCDGVSKNCTLTLEVSHFNIPASSDVSRRWRLCPRLSEISPDEVLIGDTLKIFDADTASKLLSGS